MRCRHRASSSRSYVELCAAPWLSDLGLAAGIGWARVSLGARARPAHSTIVEPSSPPGTRRCTQNCAGGPGTAGNFTQHDLQRSDHDGEGLLRWTADRWASTTPSLVTRALTRRSFIS